MTLIILHLQGGGGGSDFDNVASPGGLGWQYF